MIKKLSVLLLALAMSLSLCACKAKEETAPLPTPEETAAPTPEETVTPIPTATPAPTPTPRVVLLSALPVEDAALTMTWYLLAVNPAAVSASYEGGINAAGAEALIRFLLSENSRERTLSCIGKEGTALYSLPADAVTWSQEIAQATVETRRIHLAAAGACLDSGLLRELISLFERDYGYTVELFSADDAACADTALQGKADVLLLRSLSECDRISAALGVPVCTGMMYSKMLVSRDVLLVPTEELNRFSECRNLNDALGMIGEAGFALNDLRCDPDAAEALEEINSDGGCAICTESVFAAFSEK